MRYIGGSSVEPGDEASRWSPCVSSPRQIRSGMTAARKRGASGGAILGINAYHGDASAALVVDGELVAAAEEERFTRVKHAAGFPARAIQYCLQAAGLGPGDLDYVAVPRNPRARLVRKALHAA